MTPQQFAEVKAACDRNGVEVWPIAEAPAECLPADLDGNEEYLFRVPADRLDEDGDLGAPDELLWFLDWRTKHADHEKYAGEPLGWYFRRELPDGSVVAVTVGDDG